MNGMQSRNGAALVVGRHQTAQRHAEEIPLALEAELTRLAVPCEQRTPRGELPSRALQNRINKFRRGATKPFRVIYETLMFRIRRGENAATVTAPLYLLAAAIEADRNDDIDLLLDLDERAETESRIAARRYVKYPTVGNKALLDQCEATEQGISARIIAYGARQAVCS